MGISKGRRNPNENDMKCAIREFSEETLKENINVIQNIMPFEEILLGQTLNHININIILFILKIII